GAVAAMRILMTLPGTPFIYYGDEIGAEGVKEERAGGDDAVRPEYPPPPPSTWPPDEAAAEVLDAHREAIALRRARPWLATATVTVEHLENERLTYVVSGDRAGEALRVEVDLTESPSVSVTPAVAD
ncbi:alpha-amylase, partial [Demequina sp. TTPB684]